MTNGKIVLKNLNETPVTQSAELFSECTAKMTSATLGSKELLAIG